MVVRKEARLGRALGRLSLLCAAKPKATVAGIMVLTLIMGLGMAKLETDSDLLLILPKDNQHTIAAYNASREFRGFYDFVTVFYQIDSAKCASVSDAQLPYRLSAAACGNVTDEVYVRGMEEVWQFIHAGHRAVGGTHAAARVHHVHRLRRRRTSGVEPRTS